MIIKTKGTADFNCYRSSMGADATKVEAWQKLSHGFLDSGQHCKLHRKLITMSATELDHSGPKPK